MKLRAPPCLARAAALALTSLLAACVTAPAVTPSPDLRQPAPVTRDPGLTGNAGADGARAWPQPRWWEAYRDPTLNALVDQALQAAPTLATAQARIATAQAAVRMAVAERGPQLNADAQWQRQRLSDNGLLPPQFLGFNWYSITDVGLELRYSPDLFGVHRDAIRAADAGVQAAEADRAAAALGIASSVVQEYFGWQTDHARLQLARQQLDTLGRDATIVAARMRAELARSDESQQTELARLEVLDRLGSIETSQDMRRVALAALVGVPPEQLPALEGHELPTVAAELPDDVSLDLMARRPDLIASRWRVESSVANVALARAGFMPDLNLRALAGLSSRTLDKLLEAGSATPAISAAIHLPLFDAGRLRARHASEQARLQGAVADYQAALLTAAREINTALVARTGWNHQFELRTQQLAAAQSLQARADERLASGLTDARPQLAATRQLLTVRETALLTRYAQLTADLDLIRALGGGYGRNTNGT